MRLEPGTPAPPIHGETLDGSSLSEGVSAWRHVQFHRFAGCPMCNLAVRAFARRHEELHGAGVETVMLFHSPAEDLRKTTSDVDVPFAIVGDPERRTYDAWGVEKSTAGLLSPKAMGAAFRGVFKGYAGSPFGSGGVTGLPADFLVDSSGTLRLTRYGSHAADTLSVDEVLAATHDL